MNKSKQILGSFVLVLSRVVLVLSRVVLILSRVALVLFHVVSCCTRVVFVLSRVVSCCSRVVLCCVVLLLVQLSRLDPSDDISESLAFNLFFARVNTLLDEHAPNHKLSKKEISLKAKPW